jgi:hypothetical protein
MQEIVVLGGPNGAGKTTAAQIVVPQKLGILEFINADEIARGMSPFNAIRDAPSWHRLQEVKLSLSDLAPRRVLDAIHSGLQEAALLVALGYDSRQGPPSARLLNDALERRGFGRPVGDFDKAGAGSCRSGLEAWVPVIAEAVTGRSGAPVGEVILALRRGAGGREKPPGGHSDTRPMSSPGARA